MKTTLILTMASLVLTFGSPALAGSGAFIAPSPDDAYQLRPSEVLLASRIAPAADALYEVQEQIALIELELEHVRTMADETRALMQTAYVGGGTAHFHARWMQLEDRALNLERRLMSLRRVEQERSWALERREARAAAIQANPESRARLEQLANYMDGEVRSTPWQRHGAWYGQGGSVLWVY